MKKLMLFLVSIVLLIPAITFASTITIGDPVEGNSWGQQFNESGVGSFNIIEVYMTSSGDSFEKPVFSGFSDASWTDQNSTPPMAQTTFAQARGNGVTNLTFNIEFIGDQSNPFEFDFLAWSDNSLKEGAHAVWSGGGWAITPGTVGTYDAPVATPIPAAILLLAPGLVGLAGIRRRMAR
jgi:hypothetical protein